MTLPITSRPTRDGCTRLAATIPLAAFPCILTTAGRGASTTITITITITCAISKQQNLFDAEPPPWELDDVERQWIATVVVPNGPPRELDYLVPELCASG